MHKQRLHAGETRLPVWRLSYLFLKSNSSRIFSSSPQIYVRSGSTFVFFCFVSEISEFRGGNEDILTRKKTKFLFLFVYRYN